METKANAATPNMEIEHVHLSCVIWRYFANLNPWPSLELRQLQFFRLRALRYAVYQQLAYHTMFWTRFDSMVFSTLAIHSIPNLFFSSRYHYISVESSPRGYDD